MHQYSPDDVFTNIWLASNKVAPNRSPVASSISAASADGRAKGNRNGHRRMVTSCARTNYDDITDQALGALAAG